MQQLESPDRLVRFWDNNWERIGHMFIDIPEIDDCIETLALTVPNDNPFAVLIREDFIPSGVWHITIPAKPFAWVVTKWYGKGSDLVVYAKPIETYLRSRVMPEDKFVAELAVKKAKDTETQLVDTIAQVLHADTNSGDDYADAHNCVRQILTRHARALLADPRIQITLTDGA